MLLPAAPAAGDIVGVRFRRYFVEEVVPPPEPAAQTLVRLSCLEDDAEGEALEVLWEKEVDARLMKGEDWSRLVQGQFDVPRHFAAYYRTLRWNAVTSTAPRLFQAPYRAGIRIDAYQLEPLREALLLMPSTPGPRTRASSSRTACCATPTTLRRCATGWERSPRQPPDPGQGAQRGAGQRRALRDRFAVHEVDPRDRAAVRASSFPFSHPAQRSVEQLLGAAGNP